MQLKHKFIVLNSFWTHRYRTIWTETTTTFLSLSINSFYFIIWQIWSILWMRNSDELSTLYIIIWLHQHDVNTSSLVQNVQKPTEKQTWQICTMYTYKHLFACAFQYLCPHLCNVLYMYCTFHIPLWFVFGSRICALHAKYA